MKDKYIGFDRLPLNENGFELFRDGKPYLSLYHDCELIEFHLIEGGDFNLKLRKVTDSSNGIMKGSVSQLVLKNSSVIAVNGNGDGNLEDVNDLTLLEEMSSYLKIRLTIGSIDMVLKTSQIVLTTDL